jgi:chorismate-pyruvate lyase
MEIGMKVSVTKGDFGREMLLRLRELEEKASIRLSREQKIVLAEIGTVEQVLSILLDSPITVEVRKNVENEGIIEREVVLTREGSSDPLLHAMTLVKTAMLSKDVLQEIRSGNLGIGTIISRHCLETFRRIIEIGYDSERKTVYRVYEILYRGEAVFKVREEFSISFS